MSVMIPQYKGNRLPFPLLGLMARSGTGKTTLLLQIIPKLKAHGLRIGLIKHTHHGIQFDNAGTTQRAFASGVDVLGCGEGISFAEWHYDDAARAFDQAINHYQQLAYQQARSIDLLLVEGFKSLDFPKIELHRRACQAPLFAPSDQRVIALATDCPELLALGIKRKQREQQKQQEQRKSYEMQRILQKTTESTLRADLPSDLLGDLSGDLSSDLSGDLPLELPVLDLNNATVIADWIAQDFLPRFDYASQSNCV
ncbi:molybdopterin-guanine dinucleotide biosynthesis protein B [Ostreibacterium oceani]|uniref:Molybdopterin-guanine dinucleotide biosynthesis protein B n=1 Tax=Ostreibacterium oceani TaxID=2654998 RepID=A0A6N7EY59_9GAMM|nr:molybdopterin-guanine dinucleotide biosynthesis protein B [Ostreibacterium oceani]MPV86480.1 molybdopterin-guanine dinucleotide biosynthesis protein B [Ostreibacterium oceani]